MIQNADMTVGSTDFTTHPIARKNHNLRIPFTQNFLTPPNKTQREYLAKLLDFQQDETTDKLFYIQIP